MCIGGRDGGTKETDLRVIRSWSHRLVLRLIIVDRISIRNNPKIPDKTLPTKDEYACKTRVRVSGRRTEEESEES